MGHHADRSHARAATAVGDTEGFVEVEVTDTTCIPAMIRWVQFGAGDLKYSKIEAVNRIGKSWLEIYSIMPFVLHWKRKNG
jgi:hypothetical protein